MSDVVKEKKSAKTKCIRGWWVPQMRQMLEFVFKNCVIDLYIKDGKVPAFVCQVADHTNKDEIENFRIHFLDKNKIPLHFNYVIDPPRNPEDC